MRNNKFVFAVLAPALTLAVVFMLFPLFLGLGISFFEFNPLSANNPFVGLENYKRLLEDQRFFLSLKNTIFFVAVAVAINIVLSLIIAQFISIQKSKFARGFFRMMVFLPCVAPIACTAVVWKNGILLRDGGYLNLVLERFGIAPIAWLTNPNVIMLSLIIFTLWADLGYNTIIFSSGMDGIPTDFYEAAEIDGAGALIKFIKITIPLLARTFVFVVMMTLISYFGMTVQFMVVAQKGGPASVLSTYIYQQAFINNNMGYASAVAMVFFVLVLVVSLIQQRVNRVDWGY